MPKYSPTPEQLAGEAKDDEQRKLLCAKVAEAHANKFKIRFEPKKKQTR